MTTYIDGDSVNSQVTQIDDTDSPYTTTGESVILVDTSTAAVTVTLSTSDATASDPERRILVLDVGDNASTNNITINTEGAETIDPGDASSKTVDLGTGWLFVQSDGSNWFTSLNPQLGSPSVGSITIGSDTFSDLTGSGLSVSSGTLDSEGAIQVATGTVTASGGSSPAVDTLINNAFTTETQDYVFAVYTDADPAFNADYAYNYDYTHAWDQSGGHVDIDLTVNWDTDPGATNDVTLRWEVVR